MVLRLDIKKILSARSDRVKSVDFHPQQPWVLVALYNGHVHIWNYETQTLVKTFECSELPARAAKFIARKNWFIVGTDDLHLRVYNYNTHEKVTAFEAHTDYVRSIAVHPTQSLVLTCADDMLIKLWDWDRQWKCAMTFEGHSHYVMCVAFNPKDANSFATASLDKTIKIWNLGSPMANFTLEGHEKGVNWVDYYQGGDKPYIVSGADDRLVKVWDYQNKTCVSTLEGHTHNVCVVCFHPALPIIISGSEDGTVRVWHSSTYRLENTLNYGFERVWSITSQRGSNNIGLGYDEGTVVIKLGREDPAVSMDSSGKIIWAKHNEIQTANIQTSDLAAIKDGERIAVSTKDLGNCEVYPQSLEHSPNGRFAVVCGDGEFIIYTALSWRNKSFGSALEFVWAQDSNEYAVRESTTKIKTFKAFKEKHNLKTTYTVEGIHGGALLGARGAGFICFYDWETACAESFYVLRYSAGALEEALASGQPMAEDGLENAFEVVHEVQESVKNGCWVGDCFIYTTANNRLNYLVGGQSHTLAHFDSAMYLLGYIPKESKVFVCDKDLGIFSYTLSLTLLEYQTAILRRDYAAAAAVLPQLPREQRNQVARFLESLDQKKLAMEVTTDDEHKFDLAIQLHDLDVARKIATELDNDAKWKQLGDFALAAWDLPLAEECMRKATDVSGQLLAALATGDAGQLSAVGEKSAVDQKFNIAFLAQFLAGRVEECIALLVNSKRVPEAVLMARTYLPSAVPGLMDQWRGHVEEAGQKKIAEALCDPLAHADKFPDFKYSLVAEMTTKGGRGNLKQSSAYEDWKSVDIGTLLAQLKAQYPDAESSLPPVAELMQQAKATAVSKSAPPAAMASSPKRVSLGGASPQRTMTSASATPRDDPAARRASPTIVPASPSMARPPSSAGSSTGAASLLKPSVSATASVKNDDVDSVSDNMSYLSMDVNTTGTGSHIGELDQMTDFADAASEMSYQSSTIAMPTARAGQTHSQTQHATSVPSRQGSPAARSSPVRQASPTIPQVSPTLSAFKSPEQEALFIDDDDFAPAGNVSGAAKPTPDANANNKAGATTTSLTGDPELDDFLNM